MKLTLDGTWKQCLSMWRWIAKESKELQNPDVGKLKELWLNRHGYDSDAVLEQCFFCEYNQDYSDFDVEGCAGCPGRKIDPDFHCYWGKGRALDGHDYNWHDHPVKFYNKLVNLNRKRLKAKQGAKKCLDTTKSSK